MIQHTAYNTSAQEICDLFVDYFEGDAARPFLVVSTCGISKGVATAIEKSLEALGYQTPAWSQAQLAPKRAACPLDAGAALLLIEGLDPLRVICADAGAADILAAAYRSTLRPNTVARLWGRTAAIFADFDALISTDAGKRSAWILLKALK